MAKKTAAVKNDKTLAPPTSVGEDMNLLIARAIDKNVNVETMEKLLAMRQQLKSEWAREQYHAALSAFQSECPIIAKNKIVMNKDGKTERYRYATIDSIISQLKSLIEKHGFNYRRDAKIEGRTVEGTCIVTHKFGHAEQSSFAVPIDPEAYMNEAQKFASALTFASRYAFCNAFGVYTGDEDTDAVTISVASPTVGHRRTKPYEEETAAENKNSTADLLELSTFMSQHKIPEGFLLRLLQEKKLIDGRTKTVAAVKPGILRRCLDEKSKQRLLDAWKAQQRDEDSGSQTPPPKSAPPPPPAKPPEKSPFDSGEPTRTPLGDTNGKRKTASREPADEDQRRNVRKFVRDMSPRDYLEQEGVDNWRKVKIHFGEKEGTPLGKLSRASVEWWIENWQAKPYKGTWEDDTLLLDAALCVAAEEFENA